VFIIITNKKYYLVTLISPDRNKTGGDQHDSLLLPGLFPKRIKIIFAFYEIFVALRKLRRKHGKAHNPGRRSPPGSF
jgi:hypothetical protein